MFQLLLWINTWLQKWNWNFKKVRVFPYFAARLHCKCHSPGVRPSCLWFLSYRVKTHLFYNILQGCVQQVMPLLLLPLLARAVGLLKSPGVWYLPRCRFVSSCALWNKSKRLCKVSNFCWTFSRMISNWCHTLETFFLNIVAK